MKIEPLTLASLELVLAQLKTNNPTLCVSPELERTGTVLTNYLNAPSYKSAAGVAHGIAFKVIESWQGAQWDVQGEQ